MRTFRLYLVVFRERVDASVKLQACELRIRATSMPDPEDSRILAVVGKVGAQTAADAIFLWNRPPVLAELGDSVKLGVPLDAHPDCILRYQPAPSPAQPEVSR